MSRSERPIFSARNAVAALLLAHLLAVLVLTAYPRLHHLVHPDADDDGHDCAVVWMLHGGGGAVPPPPGLPVIAAVSVTVPAVAARPEAFVPSVFAAARVFEHAPPRRSQS